MCGCHSSRGSGPYGRPFTDEDLAASSPEVQETFGNWVRLVKEEAAAIEDGKARPSQELKKATARLFELELGDLCTVQAMIHHCGLRYENGEVVDVPKEPAVQVYRDPYADSLLGRQY